jgi:hypothetical protein
MISFNSSTPKPANQGEYYRVNIEYWLISSLLAITDPRGEEKLRHQAGPETLVA